MEINPLEIEIGVPFEVTLEHIPGLEIDSKFKVERIPFISSGFYFTHNFWLDEQTLIFESWQDNYSILFSSKFEKGTNKAIITRILPPELMCKSAVLSWNKEFLIIYDGNENFILNTADFSIEKKFKVDIEDGMETGPFSLTSDDKWIMREVNLDRSLPVPKDCKISTYIHLQNVKTEQVIKFAEKPYPWRWNHILCNPKNSNQITAALIYYDNFPTSAESDQRLWLCDISEKSNIKINPLYNQRKKRLLRKHEIVTHESWGNDGNYLTFVVRRNKLKRVEVATNQDCVIMNKGPNPWHCDGSHPDWVVFDTMNKESGIWIGKTDNSELINLCHQHTSKNIQLYHPHPFFNADKSYVFFNADFGGEGHLYRVRTLF